MKKPKTQSSPAQEAPREIDGGHFGTGFFLGLIGGSVGMFLLGTKQGHEVLQTIKKQMSERADEVLEPEVKRKLIAAAETVTETAKQTATDWQDKFPKFQRKDLSS